ncbi:MAG: response regulator transcription factor [Caldilineales bacterium]|nr:response regulator transcription factor [Caldilineales bacterium]
MSERPIRLLLIDDHAMLRQGLCLALNLQPDMEVVGEAGSGGAGAEQAARLQPDVILLDLNMPDMDGIEVYQRLQRLAPRSRVLILSGIHADARVYATVEAGVDGYIVKDASTTELVTAIRAVAAGDAYFHPMITRALTNYLRGPAQPAALDARLTTRELTVLQLIATSATNRDIAGQLHVSEETVRTHVKSILRKLNQPTRTQAVLEGVRLGLISVE